MSEHNYEVGDVVRIKRSGAIGMVSKDGGARVRVMVPYNHAVNGMILHEVLLDPEEVELAILARRR